MLLDTHIWLRWLLPTEPLSPKLTEKIQQADSIYISAISCWEAVMLNQKARIELPIPVKQWLQEATTGSGIEVIPLSCEISQLAAILPGHHKDPADRIIIATCITHKLLMSLDTIFPHYQELKGKLVR